MTQVVDTEKQLSDMSDREIVTLAHTFFVPGTSIFPRAVAGEILKRVGDAGEWGGVVEGFDAFMIGVACQRLVGNYDDCDWEQRFLRGLNFNPNTDKPTLSDFPVLKYASPEKDGYFRVAIHYRHNLKMADGLPTGDKHDECSVNEVAAKWRDDDNRFLTVVTNHKGEATAVYDQGVKIA